MRILNQVVKYGQDLDAIFGALADPTRRSIAERLSKGEASVSELAEPFDVTLPAIVKHLAVLERAGIVENWKEGRTRYCRLVPGPLDRASDWIEHYTSFWRDRFDGLHRYLDQGGKA